MGIEVQRFGKWHETQGGMTPETTKIWKHICSCHNFFPPFFCANNYYTSLLLIVSALRWYIKSLYRHLFLVDISTHARVTYYLICGRNNSKAPWATRPQIGLWVAKARSCDIDESNFFNGNSPPSNVVEKRRDHRNLPSAHAISVIPPLLNTITQGGGGLPLKKKFDA